MPETDDLFSAHVIAACESPIEHRLVGGLAALSAAGDANIRLIGGTHRSDEIRAIREPGLYPGLWLHVFPQEPVGKYRADFLIVASRDGRLKTLIVECDGKEYHQDKAKDAERDEFMTSIGYEVMRFPGAEIWADPRKCALRILRLAGQLLDTFEPAPEPTQEPLYPDTLIHISGHALGVMVLNWWGHFGHLMAEKRREDSSRENP